MDRKLKFSVLALVSIVALVAIGTLMVAADPSDTTRAPTEDWVFDEGKTTLIRNREWTIRYNITVTNGSVLKIEDCDFTFNSSNPWGPAWIRTDTNTSLEISGSSFSSDEYSNGYFLEAHDNLTVTDTTFTGAVSNYIGGYGISVYGDQYVYANFTFVKVYETWMTGGIYLKNCNMDMANSQVNNTVDNGIYAYYNQNDWRDTYQINIIDTEIFETLRAIFVRGLTNHAQVYLDCYNVDIWNISDDGIIVDSGEGTQTVPASNGSYYSTFDQMTIDTVGDQAFHLSTARDIQGFAPNSNYYNVTFTNSTVRNAKNTGMYLQAYFTVAYYNMIVDNVKFENIALDPISDRNSAMFWWWYYSTGHMELYLANSSFKRCNPAGFQSWDNGGGPIHIYNCEFTENTQYGIYLDIETSMSPTLIENCTIYDNEGYGVYVYHYNLYSGTASPVHLVNTTIERNSNTALSSYCNYYASNIGFNITNCTIRDHESLAVEIVNSYYLRGPMVLHIVNSTITNTNGMYMENSMYDYSTGQTGTLDILILNSTITNTVGTVLTAVGRAMYQGLSINLLARNSTIQTAGGDGIVMRMGRYSTSTYYNPSFNSRVEIEDCRIEDIGGISLALQVEGSDEKGTRTLRMKNTELHDAQRGIFASGYHGDLENVTISRNLKEDILVVENRINAWYCTFTAISERKFKAYDGGELYFYWDLQIIVKWDTGASAIGANVMIFDNKQTLISVQTVVSEDGSLPVDTMAPFFLKETGLFAQTPYLINVSFLQVGKNQGILLDRNMVLTIILEDHFDPEIYILYPKEGHIQQSTTLLVRGSAWDSQSGIKQVLVSLDGSTWWPARGSLRWNITIEVNESLIGRFSGSFLLRAKALDNALNERVSFVQIRVDPTPPELTINFPYHNYRTNNPNLLVRGVTELGSTVEINSQPVELVVSMFSHWLRLTEGPNTITVISIDPLGNIQIERMTVYLDTQKPYVILINPEEDPAMTNQDHLTIEAQVEDELEITVNGYEVKYDTPNYPKGAGHMTYDQALEPGENVVVIQARDKAGNLLIIDFVVIYDTIDPWIQVISPTQGAALPRPEVTIIGTVDPTATLQIDEEDVTVYNGFFERTILAYEGQNEVMMVAEDAAGNVYEETLVFSVDTQDPMVTVYSPTTGPVIVNDARYIIEGTTGFEDERENWVVSATKVLVNGEATTLIDDGTGQKVRMEIEVDPETGDFSIPVDLLQGKNELVVTAVDPVDRTRSTTHMVRLDTVAPTLVMYIDPIIVKDDGSIISHAVTVNITGYTDPGSVLTVNGILIPVSDDGEFKTPLDLSKGDTTITLVSVDSALNERSVTQTITYKPIVGDEGEETDWGFWIMVLILIVLIVVIAFFMTMYVRRQREEYIEISAAEATPIVPLDELETVVEEPDTLPGPDEISLEEEAPAPEDEPAPTTAPPRPRPRAPQQRRAAPVPVPRAEKPEVEEKDLSEKDAEADIGADETDQEGI